MTTRFPILLGVALAACEGERGVALLPPDDVELHWDSAFNAEDDGLAGLVTVDVMVYESLSGDPLEGVSIVLDSDLAALVRPEAVAPADPEEPGEEPCTLAGCPGVVWDAWRDQYLVIEAGALDAPVTLWTNEDGIGRATVYVDAFPVQNGGFEPVDVSVEVAGGEAHAVFSLIPQ